MKKTLFFLQACLLGTNCLNVDEKATAKSEKKTSEVTLELVNENVYKLKVNIEDKIEHYRLVRENNNVEVLIAEEDDVITKMGPTVRQILKQFLPILKIVLYFRPLIYSRTLIMAYQ